MEELDDDEARAAIDRSDVARNCLETNPSPRLAAFIHLYAIVSLSFNILAIKSSN